MGASDISFTLDKKATRAEIGAAFTRQRDSDADENGSQSGYSGDFQTVDQVDFHLDKVFSNENEAMDYCLEKAQKWTSVVAVYFNHAQPVKNKTIDKLNAKAKLLSTEYHKLDTTPLDTTKPFKTCANCKSKLAVKLLTRRACPLCGTSLMPKAFRNKINCLKAKIDALYSKVNDITKKDQERQAAKATNVKTLVAGWGAS